MGEQLRKKFENYIKGNLNEEETAEVENELDKLEQYQQLLNEQIAQDRSGNIKKEKNKLSFLDDEKQKKIMIKSKWKARLQNAITAICVLFIIGFVSSVLTALFYGFGTPTRSEIYRDIVASTIAITEPNVTLRSQGTGAGFFTLNMDAELHKQIGSKESFIGEINVKFLLSQVNYPERKWLIDDNHFYPFRYPNADKTYEIFESKDSWYSLEKLPEGTVAEAYVSLDRLYQTDEILQILKDKNMSPLWFAVDTGFDDTTRVDKTIIPFPIGFPYNPVWHHDDWTITSRSEEKGFLFAKSVSMSATAPTIEEFGSADVRNENFLKTLKLLQKYEGIANRIAGPKLNLKQRMDYLDSNGINIYGVVVTGPSKEILKLKNKSWVAGIQLGEVRLWNWKNRGE